MNDSIQILSHLGFSNLATLNRFFSRVAGESSRNSSDGVEWLSADKILEGPSLELRGPIGFWALGQFEDGTKIGIYSGREGRIDDYLYLVDSTGALAGSLTYSCLACSVTSLDDEELHDAFVRNPHHVFPFRSFESVFEMKKNQPLRALIRPLHFNAARLWNQAESSRYELFLRSAARQGLGGQLPLRIRLTDAQFWQELIDLEKAAGIPESRETLTMRENILFCHSNQESSDKVLRASLESLGESYSQFGLFWAASFVEHMLRQGAATETGQRRGWHIQV